MTEGMEYRVFDRMDKMDRIKPEKTFLAQRRKGAEENSTKNEEPGTKNGFLCTPAAQPL
jgi:hypothetical protein